MDADGPGLWEVRKVKRHWDGRRVDALRADNGAAKGYSGGALVVKTEDGFACAGVTWLGGADALHSHFILAPPIRDLANRHGVSLAEIDISLQPEGVPLLPSRFLPRPTILNRLRETLLSAGRSSVALVAVQGMGGLGKSVLAAALTDDAEIRQAFPDGIHWISMGNRPGLEVLAPRMQDILNTLDEPDSGKRAHASIAARFREVIGKHRVLIIADDCWDESVLHLAPTGTTSRLLITTRDKKIARRLGARPFEIEVLNTEEALDLARTIAGVDELPSEGICLVGQCKGLTLAIAMMASLARRENWEFALRSFDQVRLERFEPRDEWAANGYETLLDVFRASVHSLRSTVMKRRYQELRIFPNEEAVPVTTLATYWDIDQYEADYGIGVFDSASMGQRTTGGLLLHDLQLQYLRGDGSEGECQSLHRRLTERWAHSCGGRWSSLTDDGYSLRRLCWHLHQGKDHVALREVLSDPGWLRRKVESGRVTEVIADYALVPSEEIRRIGDAVRSSAHVLARRTDQLASQMMARLADPGPTLQRFLARLEENAPRPLLRPMAPFLRSGSFVLDGDSVAVTLTDDGRRAVSASIGGALRVWNLDTLSCECTLVSHSQLTSVVAVSSSGQRAVAAYEDKILRIWNLDSGVCERELIGHSDFVFELAVTRDGKRAVSASHLEALWVWNLDSGLCERKLVGHSASLSGVAVTADGKRVISAYSDDTVRVWNLDTGDCEHVLEFDINLMVAAAVTADSRRVIFASHSGTLFVWNLHSGVCEYTLEGHPRGITHIAVTGDGKRAISASVDTTMRVWNLDYGCCELTLEGHLHTVQSVSITGDNKRAISVSMDGTLRAWDLDSGDCEFVLAVPWDCSYLALTNEGSRGVLRHNDRTLRVWSLDSGASSTPSHPMEWIVAVDIGADGRRAVTVSRRNVALVWNLSSGDCEFIVSGGSNTAQGIALTGDSKRVVTASMEGTVFVWNCDSHLCEYRLQGHTDRISSIATTRDGRHAMSASRDGTVRVWNLDTGVCEYVLDGHREPVQYMAVAGNGSRAVACFDGKPILSVWNLEPGACERILEHTSLLRKTAITWDGRCAVSASEDRTLRVWNLESGACEHTVTVNWDCLDLAVADDGSIAVFACNKSGLHVWDLKTGEWRRVLWGHDRLIRAVALTNDARRAVSVSTDKTLRVWDLETGDETAYFEGDDPLICVALSADSIVAGCPSGRVYLLRINY